MSRKTLERISTDWFDLVSQQLEELRLDCQRVQDKSTIPSDARFALAKRTIEKFRQLAEFPNLPEPDVWVGADGELGITWQFPAGSLELLFADEILARAYTGSVQQRLELSKVAPVLAFLTAQTAA